MNTSPSNRLLPGRAGLDACIIDLDGTLVDTLGDFEAALNQMLASLSRPPVGRAVIEHLVGKGSEHLIRSVLVHVEALRGNPGLVASAALFDEAWQAYQRDYRQINGRHSVVYPGVVEGLRALQDAGLRLACLTNKPGAFARDLLKIKGLDGFFTEVFGGDAFERKKPDPLPLLKTCAALGSEAARTLMVGFQQRCRGRAGRRLSGGAGELRLQPRGTCPRGRRGWLPEFAGRTGAPAARGRLKKPLTCPAGRLSVSSRPGSGRARSASAHRRTQAP